MSRYEGPSWFDESALSLSLAGKSKAHDPADEPRCLVPLIVGQEVMCKAVAPCREHICPLLCSTSVKDSAGSHEGPRENYEVSAIELKLLGPSEDRVR